MKPRHTAHRIGYRASCATRRRRSIWLLALSALLLSECFSLSSASAEKRGEAGLYVYMNHPSLKNFDEMYDAALAADYIDGAAISIEWNLVEPNPHVYDWSHLDKWVEKAILLNKKLSLGIIAGHFAPEWLYDPQIGVPRNNFNYNRNPRGVFCSVLAQPSPWHPAYLREYGAMITALSGHLRDMQVAGRPRGAVYDAVRIVKLSGINVTTEELRVAANKPDDGPCKQSDATAIWADAGFTPNRILSAWMKIATDTAQAFPDKTLAVDIIHRGAFPSIDDNGQIYTPSHDAPDDLTVMILNAAVPMFRDRLMVKWNALWQAKAPQEVLDAGHKGAQIGWQMNGFMGVREGSGCIYKPFVARTCETIDDFRAILDNGIAKGGNYIEIQAPNLNPNYAPAFESTHRRMKEALTPGR